jgi:uncharacterized membrane protein YkvI
MLILGLCIYYSIEYARLTKTHTFKQWANKLFSPYDKIFASIFEFTYIFTVLMVVGSCIATGATALNQYLSIPMIIGTLIIAGLTLFLSMYGAALVRASSSIMTLAIILALSVIIFAALKSPYGNLSENYSATAFAIPSVRAAIWSAIVYAGFQATGNIANSVSVSEGLNSKKDSLKAVIYGIALNAGLIIGIATILFAFPEAIKASLPNYYIAESLGFPWLLALYVVVLLLAVLTTTVGFAFSVTARYSPLIKTMETGPKRDALVSTVMLVMCIGVSTFGLDKIVRVGFGYLGKVSIFFVIIPVLVLGFVKTRKLEKEEKNNKAIV